MIYYFLAAFFILMVICAHVMLAHAAHLLIKDLNWFKKPYKKYLLIPGIAEATIGIVIIAMICIVIYVTIKSFFEE